MKPTIGRIVLFNSRSEGEVPAIVTAVHSDTCVNLTVFNDGGIPSPAISVEEDNEFDTSGRGCGWHWMEYQKAVAAGQIAATQHAGS